MRGIKDVWESTTQLCVFLVIQSYQVATRLSSFIPTTKKSDKTFSGYLCFQRPHTMRKSPSRGTIAKCFKLHLHM